MQTGGQSPSSPSLNKGFAEGSSNGADLPVHTSHSRSNPFPCAHPATATSSSASATDCWQASERDASGRLQPHPERFPDGIQPLVEHAHAHGLKLGIYSDAGYLVGQIGVAAAAPLPPLLLLLMLLLMPLPVVVTVAVPAAAAAAAAAAAVLAPLLLLLLPLLPPLLLLLPLLLPLLLLLLLLLLPSPLQLHLLLLHLLLQPFRLTCCLFLESIC